MFARFDENPAMTLRVIKETKRYGRTDRQTDNVKTVYPLQTKFAGGIKILLPTVNVQSKTKENKRAPGPWMAHLSPGTYDVLACG